MRTAVASFVACSLSTVLLGSLVHCGGAASAPYAAPEDASSMAPSDGGPAPKGPDDSNLLFDGGGSPAPGGPATDGGAAAPLTYVYSHSNATLFRLDPVTMQTSTVGTFSGCSGVIDLAIDENQNAVVTTMDGLYKLDLATAACTRIANGSYPNSLSFLPKGVLDPDREVLVGYNGSSYVRIDVATGAATVVGALQGNLMSSGDIVSVKDGGTFLTVTGPNCSDCVIQVDPRTGQMLKNLGPIPYASVWGLAYWGGSLYGFTDGGKVFRVSAQGDGIVTTPVALPPGPAGIRFWGAGSSTVVPVKDSNGAGLPIVIR